MWRSSRLGKSGSRSESGNRLRVRVWDLLVNQLPLKTVIDHGELLDGHRLLVRQDLVGILRNPASLYKAIRISAADVSAIRQHFAVDYVHSDARRFHVRDKHSFTLPRFARLVRKRQSELAYVPRNDDPFVNRDGIVGERAEEWTFVPVELPCPEEMILWLCRGRIRRSRAFFLA